MNARERHWLQVPHLWTIFRLAFIGVTIMTPLFLVSIGANPRTAFGCQFLCHVSYCTADSRHETKSESLL
jgi:hypothetical protein